MQPYSRILHRLLFDIDLHHRKYLIQALFIYCVKLYDRMLVIHLSAVVENIKLVYITEKVPFDIL